MNRVDVTVPPKIRLTELDGLRGWAALSVAIFHIYWESFGNLHPEIRNVVTASLLNGHFAVCIFFVVSGAALSSPFLAGGGRAYVMSAAIRRYVRLTPPIVLFSLIFFALAEMDLVFSNEAAEVLQRPHWGGLNSTNDPGLINTVLFMTRDVYLGAEGERDLLPFLWTMPIEMMGSILLFLLLACADLFRERRRSYLWISALVFLVSPYLGAFFIGAGLAWLRIRGVEWSTYRRFPRVTTAVILSLGFGTAAITHLGGLPSPVAHAMNVLGASALVYLCMSNLVLRRLLGGTWLSAFLGRISFTIYILHYVIITTVLSGLVLHFQDSLGFATCMAIATASLALSVALSWVFSPIDTASHRFSRRFSTLVLGKPD